MSEAMRNWHEGQLDADVNKTKVFLRRSHVLTDAMRAFKSPRFNARSGVTVTFVGEPGIDTGGLTREFASLITPVLRESKYFCGEPGNTTAFIYQFILADNIIIIAMGHPCMHITLKINGSHLHKKKLRLNNNNIMNKCIGKPSTVFKML